MSGSPVVARGHNVAVYVPPVTRAALPYLEAVAARAAGWQPGEGQRCLVLTADADRAVQLAESFDAAFGQQGLSAIAVSGLARAAGLLKDRGTACLFASVPDALELLRRSALQLAGLLTAVFAWPEELDAPGCETLETVMAEVPHEAQRVILTASPGSRLDDLIERHAWRAVLHGFPPAGEAVAPLGPARFVVARPPLFAATSRRVLDALNPEREGDLVIAPCPESREEAGRLAERAGPEVPPVFVIEPHQLGYLRTLFQPLEPLRLPTAVDALAQRAEAVRSRLVRALEQGDLDRELFLVGPLLDRFDPAEVAAAALRLAAEAAPLAAPAPAPAPEVPVWAKLYVSVGKRDNVKPADLVGAITGEVGVPASHIGRIECREQFSLVEIRAEDATRAVRELTGATVRGRRLTVRIDRGPGPGPRPAKRS